MQDPGNDVPHAETRVLSYPTLYTRPRPGPDRGYQFPLYRTVPDK